MSLFTRSERWLGWLCLMGLLTPGATLPAIGATGAEVKATLRAAGRLADSSGVYNAFIAAQVGSDGAFNFGALPGAGSNLTGPNSFNLSFSWPSSPGSSYTTLRLDGSDFVLGRDIPASGTVTAGDTATTTYRHGTIAIQQTLSIVSGLASGRPDTIRIRYAIDHQDEVSHEIGLRIMIDTMLAGNDAASFRIPGPGEVTTETLFTGSAVPSFWQAFASLADPTIVARGDLLGGGATPPDRFAIANWGRIQGTPYDWSPNVGEPTGDSAIGIWWDPRPVGPGATRELTTFYGLGEQTVVEGALLLGVTAPAEYEPGQPEPLTFVATVENPSTATIPEVLAELDVPTGFALTAGAMPSLLGDLAPGEARQVTWSVAGAANLSPDDYRFTITARSSDSQIQPVSLQRSVRVGTPPAPGDASAAESTFSALPDDLLEPGGELAILGEPVRLRIVVRDAAGQPLPGVDPGRLGVVAAPAGAVIVTPPALPTDEQGVTVATVVSQTAGPVELGLQVDGSRSPSIVHLLFGAARRATARYDLAAGIHLLSLPLLRAEPRDSEAWRDLDLFTWDAANGSYRRLALGQALGLNEGFFARLPSPRSLIVDGYAPLAPPDGAPLELTTSGAGGVSRLPADFILAATDFRLRGEWNLLGNPSHLPLPWLFDRLNVVVDGAVIGSLSDPATWEYVDPYAFVFDGQQYRLVFDGRYPGFEQTVHEVPVLHGFWMHRKPGPGSVALRLAESSPSPPRAVSGGWAVSLLARQSERQDTVVVGGGQRLSLLEPPSVGAAGLSIVLLEGAQRLTGRIRDDGVTNWEAEVTAPAGEVVLSWPRLGRSLPGGYGAVLVDRQTGRRVSLQAHAAYRFASDGSPRRFGLDFGPTGGQRLQVQVQPAPTRSRSASFTLLLTAPATVRVEVTGLTGRLIRELTATATVGATVVGWDGLDQQGRRVPAGVYQVRVTAMGDDGELARAMGTVTIR